MAKKQKHRPLPERLKEAIDEGNLEKALSLYEYETKGYAAYGMGLPNGYDLTPKMIRQAVLNGCKEGSRDIARQITRRVLSFQTSLLVRAETYFQHELAKYDEKYGTSMSMTTDLPLVLIEDHLPRIGKLQMEIRSTIKVLLELEKEETLGNGKKAT